MNGFSITPFHGLHLLLLLLTASATILIFLLLRGKREARRANMLISVCLCNLALFTAYKLSLSRDAVYVSAYYPNGFNLFNELPLHLCNINLFLIPMGVWKRNRSIMGFSFFVAPLGALMALLFPEPLFSGFSLLLPRIFGYYVTHAVLVVCGLSLATLGFYRPDSRDIPRILKTFVLLALSAHLTNVLFRLTVCPEANYFFTYGAEVGALELLWRIIPRAAALRPARAVDPCSLYASGLRAFPADAKQRKAIFSIGRTAPRQKLGEALPWELRKW